ncbi:MAG: hypothetical protein JWP89_878 [Schlesneria sp.]|nr:hypothetical protein [Schlesneria sp.]
MPPRFHRFTACTMAGDCHLGSHCDGTNRTDGTDVRRLLLTAQLARGAMPAR